MTNNKSQIIIYKAEDGQTKIDVRFDGETVWLTQNALAELFQTTKQNISRHIKNIFEEGELQPDSTVKDFLTVQREGGREVSRELEYHNLDLIISVGYRVKSSIATAFRRWATARLREYIVKGFVIDDERLKTPTCLLIILKNFSSGYRISVLPRSGFTEKSPIFMPRALITIRLPR